MHFAGIGSRYVGHGTRNLNYRGSSYGTVIEDAETPHPFPRNKGRRSLELFQCLSKRKIVVLFKSEHPSIVTVWKVVVGSVQPYLESLHKKQTYVSGDDSPSGCFEM